MVSGRGRRTDNLKKDGVMLPPQYHKIVRHLGVFAALVALNAVPTTALAGNGTPGQKLSGPEIARRVSPAVVTIVTPSGSGSGVIVDARGTVVTNLHVVRGDAEASVRLANGDIYDDVQVVDVDARKDLVVLKIKAFNLTPAVMGNSDQVSVGDRIFVIGSPRGLQSTLSDGLISAVRDSGEGYRLFQTTAPVSPGSSGGGLFNESGELVGIVVAKRTDAENVNFVLPGNYARGLLASTTMTSLADLARRYPAEAAPAPGQTGAVDPAAKQRLTQRLQQVIAESGLTFAKNGESWRAEFQATHAKSVYVDVSVYGDLALIQSQTIWTRPLTAGQMLELLTENFQTDLAKIGLLKDTLVASTEAEIRTLDGPLLKRLVESVAALADDTFGGLSEEPDESTYEALDAPSRWRSATTLNLNNGAAALKYDASLWKSFGAREDMQFKHSNGEIFFRVVAERTGMSYDALETLAVANARNVDTNAKVARKGWRVVNGQKLMVLEIEATASGVPILYYGHYYVGPAGTIQIVGWTAKNLLDEHRSEFESVVSGFQLRR